MPKEDMLLKPEEIEGLRPKPLDCGRCGVGGDVCKLTELDKARCWARKVAKAQLAKVKQEPVCPDCKGRKTIPFHDRQAGAEFKGADYGIPCPTCQGKHSRQKGKVGVNWSNCPYWSQCEDENKHIMTYCDIQCSNTM